MALNRKKTPLLQKRKKIRNKLSMTGGPENALDAAARKGGPWSTQGSRYRSGS